MWHEAIKVRHVVLHMCACKHNAVSSEPCGIISLTCEICTAMVFLRIHCDVRTPLVCCFASNESFYNPMIPDLAIEFLTQVHDFPSISPLIFSAQSTCLQTLFNALYFLEKNIQSFTPLTSLRSWNGGVDGANFSFDHLFIFRNSILYFSLLNKKEMLNLKDAPKYYADKGFIPIPVQKDDKKPSLRRCGACRGKNSHTRCSNCTKWTELRSPEEGLSHFVGRPALNVALLCNKLLVLDVDVQDSGVQFF